MTPDSAVSEKKKIKITTAFINSKGLTYNFINPKEYVVVGGLNKIIEYTIHHSMMVGVAQMGILPKN